MTTNLCFNYQQTVVGKILWQVILAIQGTDSLQFNLVYSLKGLNKAFEFVLFL